MIAVAGCTFPPLRTTTPSPSPSPSPSPTPTPTATPSPTHTPEPTPDAASIPGFHAGEIVATAIDGLRVRQRPSLSSVVVPTATIDTPSGTLDNVVATVFQLGLGVTFR